MKKDIIAMNGREFTLDQFEELTKPRRGESAKLHAHRLAKAFGIGCATTQFNTGHEAGKPCQYQGPNQHLRNAVGKCWAEDNGFYRFEPVDSGENWILIPRKDLLMG